MRNKKLCGQVSRINKEKKYGFIQSKDIEGEVYFKLDQVEAGADSLAVGNSVEFALGKIGTNGKWTASAVWALEKKVACFVPSGTPLMPQDSFKIVDPAKIDNFSLQLNKCIHRSNDDKFYFFRTQKGKIEFQLNPDFKAVDVEAINLRQQSMLEASGLQLSSIKLNLDWRLAIGLGQASVYETSINLHHIYGIPFIPGSAIKGVVRNWVLSSYFAKEEGDAKTGAYADEGFCRIFGSPENSKLQNMQGAVRFFDAFPSVRPTIKPDIMNSHYGKYYTEGLPPGDYYNPNPIYFLTIQQSPFTFSVGTMPSEELTINSGVFEGKDIMEVVNAMLNEALTMYGIGAKTAIGYGYFS